MTDSYEANLQLTLTEMRQDLARRYGLAEGQAATHDELTIRREVTAAMERAYRKAHAEAVEHLLGDLDNWQPTGLDPRAWGAPVNTLAQAARRAYADRVHHLRPTPPANGYLPE